MSLEPGFTRLQWAGQTVQLETQWVGEPRSAATPLIVFLHEGLGSVALWREFPQRLCEAASATGLVYSRPGYGRSTPRPAQEKWRPDFMHRQALEVLPALLEAQSVSHSQPVWLFGHSDGGSIALLHAAEFGSQIQGVITLAPHLFVEDISVSSIADARVAYEQQGLREKLARFHDDVDSAFYGWNDIWLDSAFRDWNIETEISKIRCPVLAVQGFDDQYGTMAQIDRIQELVPAADVLKLENCEHSPQKDQADAVIENVVRFMSGCSRA